MVFYPLLNKILYNPASCWLYLKEYINDVRSHERQMEKSNCEFNTRRVFRPLDM